MTTIDDASVALDLRIAAATARHWEHSRGGWWLIECDDALACVTGSDPSWTACVYDSRGTVVHMIGGFTSTDAAKGWAEVMAEKVAHPGQHPRNTPAALYQALASIDSEVA
jgi:hypothetical protein